MFSIVLSKDYRKFMELKLLNCSLMNKLQYYVLKKQRLKKKYFFLTWGVNGCHDMDEWIGIYENLSELRKVYNEEVERKRVCIGLRS